MRHLFSPIITMPIYSSSTSPSSIHTRPRKPSSSSSSSSSSPNSNCNSLLCKHSPSATLDILILILVLFSGTFLLTSYFAYIFQSLSLLLPLSLSSFQDSPFPYIFGFVIVFVATFLSVEICCGYRSRKCDKLGCKGLKKALEFDLQLQTEECLRSSLESKDAIDKLPWKGGTEGNPDYECLRSELRKMAPHNGRAVLLFRARCGCPVAKLEGWGPKRSRRHKKGLALNGGGGADHR